MEIILFLNKFNFLTIMTKFYKCNVCGNIITKLHDSGITPSCCSRTMTELVPNEKTGSEETHMPCVCRIDCSTIKVVIGRIPHPMDDNHRIRFIYLETNKGGQIQYLKPSSPPEALFFTTDIPISIYAFCNIHGLWKASIPNHNTVINKYY